MHIGFDIRRDDFDVQINGEPSTRETLLEWDLHSRIGILVDRPYGAVDASTLIFLAGMAFYDATPKRRRRPLYPNMYLFHVGGRWGSHMPFDFFPDRKEIAVESDPREVMRAINQIGITHLVLPDRQRTTVKHRFKEPEEALDRIKKAFVYGRDARVDRADVAISANRIGAVRPSMLNTLNPVPFLETIEAMVAGNITSSMEAGARKVDPVDMRRVLPGQHARSKEGPDDDPERLRLLARIAKAEDEGRLTEHFRQETIKSALMMLA